jgi:hypothetical protein
MAEGHVCDQYTTHEWEGGGLGEYSPRKFLNPGNVISCILSIQICSKIYANSTCI